MQFFKNKYTQSTTTILSSLLLTPSIVFAQNAQDWFGGGVAAGEELNLGIVSIATIVFGTAIIIFGIALAVTGEFNKTRFLAMVGGGVLSIVGGVAGPLFLERISSLLGS